MLNPTASVTVTSNVATGAQVMGIDEQAMGTVLSILSNMYSDGNLAVVREYACNAYDSHVEAGNSDPILITSPTFLDPRLTVQDFGVGLSWDEMLNVYAKYGASTKRNTNDQIGSFGIGAKSAFTVGTQFVVTAVKDGEQTVALFALNEAGAPTVNIVSNEPSDEPNGVKVEIGVKDVPGVQSAIERLFPTWQPGTVLVDGVEPASIWADVRKLAEDVHLTWREDRYDLSNPAFLVVMGGVSYRLPDSVVSSLEMRARTIVRSVQSTDAKVIFSVPIGSVDITPSREDLQLTTKTTATVDELVERFNQSLPAWIIEQIDEAESMVGAMIKRRHLQSRIGNFARDHLDAATWRGRRMGIAKIETGMEYVVLRSAKRYSYANDGKVAKRIKPLELLPNSEIERMLFVTNVPERRVRSVQLAAKPYLKAQPRDIGVNTVVCVHGDSFSDEWFDLKDKAVTKISFEEFVAQWKPVVSTAGGGGGSRGVVQYAIGSADSDDTLTVAELVELDDVLYLTAEGWDSMNNNFGHQFLQKVSQSFTLVVLSNRQSVGAFLKRVPGAQSAQSEIRAVAEKTFKSVTQADWDYMDCFTLVQNANRSIINFLEAQRNSITNKVVLDVLDLHVKAQAAQGNASQRIRQLRDTATFLGQALDESKSLVSLNKYNDMVEALPLLRIYIARSWEKSPLGDQHVIAYVNSIVL